MIARLAVCVAVVLLAGPHPEEKPSSKPLELLPIERNIVTYTNVQRTKSGLAALKIDDKLVQSARRRATWMTLNRSLQHTTENVAENIARGQRDSREAVGDWMNSPGHRANILNPGYRRIGAAAYRTPEGTIYWCQQFLP